MSFEPIRTERLILRRPRLADAEAAYQRRSLPEVARYQDWEMPYTMERAEKSMARTAAMDGPAVDQGWTITVVDAEAPDRILGDLAVQLRWGGRTGYFGYTFRLVQETLSRAGWAPPRGTARAKTHGLPRRSSRLGISTTASLGTDRRGQLPPRRRDDQAPDPRAGAARQPG